jgi:hypothetical protein
LVCFVYLVELDKPHTVLVGDTFARKSVANPGGQYSELAILALRWAMAFRIRGCGKILSAQRSFEGMHFWNKIRTFQQDVQKGRLARPQRAKGRGVRFGTLSL